MKQMSMMSPQEIALEYDGNKQKIAAAAQAGLLDPTSAVMAGMFIDRMRAAAVQEQASPTTVEQDVLSPPRMPARPMLPAGLGATPEAQQLQEGQDRAMQTMPPVEQGVAALPVDERLIPGGAGYAGGGIVAFAGDDEDVGSLVDINNLAKLERLRMKNLPASEEEVPTEELTVSAAAPTIPSIQSGKRYSLDDLIKARMAVREQYAPMGEEEKALADYYKSAPTRAAEAKSRGINEFLAEMGFRAAASKSPRALQAFGEAGTGAMPRITAAGKEARELEELGMKGRAELAKTERAQKLAGVAAGEKAFGEQESEATRERIANAPPDALRIANAIRKPGESLDSALGRATELTNKADKYNAISTRVTGAMKAMYESTAYDALNRAYKNAKTDADRAKIEKQMEDLRTKYLQGHEVGPGDIAFMRSFTEKYGATQDKNAPPPGGPGAPPPGSPGSPKPSQPVNAKTTMVKADIDATLAAQKKINPNITRSDIIKAARDRGFIVDDR